MFKVGLSMSTFFLKKRSRRRLIKWISGISIGWIGLALMLAYVLPFVLTKYSPLTDGYISEWQRIENRSQAILVHDSQNRYLGIIPRSYESDFVVRNDPVRVLGIDVTKDHKSALLENAPEDYWGCLKYLEDRHFETARNPFGVDLISTLGMPVTRRGGSTLSMQLFRSLISLYPRPRKKGESYFSYSFDTLKRKAREWVGGPILQSYLIDKGGQEEFAKWTANHIALIQGGGDYDIYGVELAGRTLFGKSASELEPAEQFVLAAAVRSPISFRNTENRVRSDGSIAYGTIHRTWRKPIRTRAVICANALIKNEDLKYSTLARLEELASGIPQPFVHRSIVKELDKSIKNPLSIGKHPERLARNTITGINELVGELKNIHGSEFRNRSTKLNLTIDAVTNLRFANSLETALKKNDDRLQELGSSYCFTIDPDSQRCNKPENLLPLSVSISNNKGQLKSIYSTDEYSNYFGSLTSREKELIGRGASNIDLEVRQISSLGKIAAGLLLAELGTEVLDTKWSNNCILDDRGCSKGKVSPREIFARSLNDALIRRTASKINQTRISTFMDIHNFTLPLNSQGDPEYTSLVLGKYAGSMQSIQMLLNTALTYVTTGKVNEIYLPTLVKTNNEQKQKYLGEVLKEGGKTFALRTLESPLCHRRGTLRRISSYCAINNKKIAVHIAKTGTTGNANKDGLNEYDYFVGGALVTTSGNSYSYIVRAGTASPSDPVLKNVGSGKVLSPIVKQVIEHILWMDKNEPT